MYREDTTHTDSSSDESPPHSPASSTSSLGDGHAIPSRLGNFRLLTEFQLGVAPFTKVVKWQSEKSGLKVVWADTPGALATGSSIRSKAARSPSCSGCRTDLSLLDDGRDRSVQLERHAAY